MLCDPTDNDEVDSEADPPLNAAVPSVVEPSLKVMVPVGEVPVTVVDKFTLCPKLEGFAEDATVVVEANLLTVKVAAVEVTLPHNPVTTTS